MTLCEMQLGLCTVSFATKPVEAKFGTMDLSCFRSFSYIQRIGVVLDLILNAPLYISQVYGGCASC